jgi:hypothetical protein
MSGALNGEYVQTKNSLYIQWNYNGIPPPTHTFSAYTQPLQAFAACDVRQTHLERPTTADRRLFACLSNP